MSSLPCLVAIQLSELCGADCEAGGESVVLCAGQVTNFVLSISGGRIIPCRLMECIRFVAL